MPLTAKGSKILKNMEAEYGKKKGTSVFYASRNAGKISGVDSARRDAMSEISGACDKYDAAHKDDSKFSTFVSHLEKKGYSKNYATKVAAKVGREKYGAKAMGKKSAAARHDVKPKDYNSIPANRPETTLATGKRYDAESRDQKHKKFLENLDNPRGIVSRLRKSGKMSQMYRVRETPGEQGERAAREEVREALKKSWNNRKQDAKREAKVR